MNSFDEVQCEESPQYQWAMMMYELEFLKEQHEKQASEMQKVKSMKQNILMLYFTT